MLLENLESRTLLSASAVNTQIQADRAQVNADLTQFKADLYATTTTIHTDVLAIKADDPGQATTLTPLIRKLNQDVTAMHLQLDADLLAQGAAVRQDQATIITDTLQFIADKGNPTARAADRIKILADRIQLQTDAIAGLNARIATRKADYTQISADLLAIETAVQSDTGASTQLQSDVQRFTTDRTNELNTILADLSKIKEDRTQLAADLTALQTQPPLV